MVKQKRHFRGHPRPSKRPKSLNTTLEAMLLIASRAVLREMHGLVGMLGLATFLGLLTLHLPATSTYGSTMVRLSLYPIWR